MENLTFPCPGCGESVVDEGRAADWLGPYAPYSPAEQSAAVLDTLPPGAAPTGCPHAVRCSACGMASEAVVRMWP
ncbi:hypothetical protein [Cohnella nanjingensis]|nr:hypothetical protein [Cohnella nanjingensis]